MTGIQLFAFVILPLAIAAGGASLAYFYGRRDDKHHLHPGE